MGEIKDAAEAIARKAESNAAVAGHRVESKEERGEKPTLAELAVNKIAQEDKRLADTVNRSIPKDV
jgi:hypothetical protein